MPTLHIIVFERILGYFFHNCCNIASGVGWIVEEDGQPEAGNTFPLGRKQ